jgi:HEXXH motif-containing protein
MTTPCYAPWRDDPRPRSALLQGSYAFLGVAAMQGDVQDAEQLAAAPLIDLSQHGS